MSPTSRPPHATGRRSRSGVIVLELILGVMVGLVLIVAVVEFGLLVANYQHVVQTTQSVARFASEVPANGLNSIGETQTVTNEARDLADDLLAGTGLPTSATVGVHLQHTVGPTDFGAEAGTCPLAVDPTQPDDTVRVSVCVSADRLAPDLLSTLGFTLQGRTVQFTVTVAHDNP